MKYAPYLLLSLALSFSAHATSEAQLKREMQLKISEAYSQCAAYYHVAAATLKAGNNPGVRDAKKMKKSSVTHAIAMATEHVGKRGAKKQFNKHFKLALDEMNLLGKTDTAKFGNVLGEYRTSCRTGVEEPHVFIDEVLSNYTKPKPTRQAITRTKLPSASEILRRGKRTTGVKNSNKCTKPNTTVAIPLNDILVENSQICSDHRDGACSDNQEWMSHEQYIKSLYPTRELVSFSTSSSMTFSNGKAQRKTEIRACLTAS